MNKEKLEQVIDIFKDLEQLIEENKNLKTINRFLYKSIQVILKEASKICSVNERNSIIAMCQGTLIASQRIAEELGVKIEDLRDLNTEVEGKNK